MEVAKSPKRLLIDVTPEDHKRIKKMATERGISMRLWVMRAIAEQFKREKEVGNLVEETK